MKKVLFIQPHKIIVGKEKDAFVRPMPSLPAMTILGQLKEDYETDFIDATADNLNNVFSYNENIQFLGMGKEEILGKISAINPDVILLTSMFSAEYFVVNWMAKTIKEMFDLPIIVGGHHASLLPKWHLEEGNIDSVIIGEGELIIKNAVSYALSGKLKRIYEGKRLHNLDQPWEIEKVMFNDQGRARYTVGNTIRNPGLYASNENPDNPVGVLYMSRGCPFECPFCNAAGKDGKKLRHMSLEASIRLVEDFERLGASILQNESDAFCLHPNDIKFLEYIAAQREKGIKINLINTNGLFVRYFFPAGDFSKERADLLKNAGLDTISLSIDSFNHEYNNNKLEGISYWQIKEAVGYLKSVGLKIDIYLIVGFPNQTKEEMDKDLELASGLGADILTIRALEILPGTRYYDEAVQQGKLAENQYKEMMGKGYSFYGITKSRLNLSSISLDELKEITGR